MSYRKLGENDEEVIKNKFILNIIKCLKYESVEICNNILFFLIFLFGLSNALQFGEKWTEGRFCY